MAKKKKIQKTNAMRQLDRAKIPYEIHEYAWKEDALDAEHVAEALDKDIAHVYKTIVTVGKDTGPVVAVVPGDATIDLKKLAVASHNKRVELLPLKELEGLTGYVRGGCSPLGMKKAFPTYIDEQAQSLETITVSAGRRGLQVEVDPKVFVDLVDATFAPIVMEGEENE